MGLQEAERGGGLHAMNHGGDMLLPSRAVSWRQRPPEYGFCQTNNKVKNVERYQLPQNPGLHFKVSILVTPAGRSPRRDVCELPGNTGKI